MRFDCLVIVSVPCTKNPVFFWQSLQILTKNVPAHIMPCGRKYLLRNCFLPLQTWYNNKNIV